MKNILVYVLVLLFSASSAIAGFVYYNNIKSESTNRQTIKNTKDMSINTKLSEIELSKMLQASDKEKSDATRYIIDVNPASVSPFTYADVISNLWQSGDKSQAVFWFYMFQSRTRAWATSDTTGDGYGAIRSVLNEQMGVELNAWVGSDLDAWQDIAARAISYEKKIPVYAGKPEGISNEEWDKLVKEERTKYEADFVSNFPKPEDKKNYELIRKSNGLYVGPLQNPGKPLSDTWR